MHIRKSNLAGLGAFPCNGSTTFVMAVGNTIASPCSKEFLGKFQGLQRSINEFIDIFALRIEDVPAKVRVDGDIGPGTLAAARAVWEIGSISDGVTNWPASPPASAKDLAENVDLYSSAFAAGPVDRTADPASQKPPGSNTSDFKPVGPPRSASMGGPILLAMGAGVIAYKILGKKKKR